VKDPAQTIKAITFDLWDTIVVDDSDEPKRRQQGLRPKRDARRHLLWEALNRQSPIDAERVRRAYDVGDAAFNRVWHDQHVTWPIQARIEVILAGLGRSLPAADLAAVVAAHERMEVDIPPDLIPGCADALGLLADRFQLAIVSDAIVTPGRGLRELLAGHGVARFFSGFAFSDEVGHSKPHRDMFAAAAEQLDVRIDQMIHIGDRDHNDIQGPQRLGMRAILFTASRSVDRDRTTADAICDSYAALPAIVDRLAASEAG
jgi:putative hydrolase of the HAD superfamily